MNTPHPGEKAFTAGGDDCMQALFESSPLEIFVRDLRGRYVVVSPQSARRLATPVDQVLGKRPEDVYDDPERAAAIVAHDQAVLESGRAMTRVHRTREQGTEHVFLDTTFPVRDPDGEIRGIGCVSVDVTGREQFEQKPWPREGRLENTEQTRTGRTAPIPERMAAASADLHCFLTADRRCFATSPACYEIVGMTMEELLGRSVSEMSGAEPFHSRVKSFVDRALCGERIHTVEWFDFPHRGRRRIDECYNPCLAEDGTMLGMAVDIRDVTERWSVEQELRSSREQLRGLATALQEVREKERSVISREIHDELGQALTGLKLLLSRLLSKLPRDGRNLQLEGQTLLASIDTAVASVRRISSSLRPAMLDDLGLVAAVKWMIGQFGKRTGIDCVVYVEEDILPQTKEAEIAEFRILQEALTNIARHASAGRVTVTLIGDDDGVLMEVTDDGAGISDDALADPRALGMISMRERTGSVGGTLDVAALPNGGTRVTLTVPYQRSEEREQWPDGSRADRLSGDDAFAGFAIESRAPGAGGAQSRIPEETEPGDGGR